MRSLALAFCLLALPSGWESSLADGTQTPSEECAGTISGRVFFFGSRRWPNAPVYLLDLEQSAPLRQLVRKTSRRLRSLGAGAPSTHDVAAEFYNKVAGLVPKLPRISKVRADKVGAYEFGNVATGKRYYLVAMDVGEDGVFYAAAETPLLHPRQQLKLDIREINLWYAE